MSGQSVQRSALDALAEDWASSWVGREGAGFDRCCTPDVGYEDPVLVEPLDGLEALTEHARLLRGGFPDLRVERPSASLARGRFACIPWRLLGTHRGELAALPPTDRFVILHGVHYVELVDGRIRRARGFFDLYDVAIQLGLLPGRGSLGETALLLLRGFGLRRKD
jgi:predicted ester cyclase